MIMRLYSAVTALLLFSQEAVGLQNLFAKQVFQAPSNKPSAATNLEDSLLQAIEDLGDSRLANSEKVERLVVELENSGCSIPQPAISDEVYGRWRLIHTDNSNTASPIQRKAVDSSAFPIYQDIIFNAKNELVVSQVVKFKEGVELKVDALASTSAYPLAELTERKRDGKILGINLLGVSKVGADAKQDPGKPDSRIDFVFDEGKFDWEGRFSVPYPVPFRLPLLRDAVKGWIDITYLSERLRIARGNKGTSFILVKEQ